MRYDEMTSIPKLDNIALVSLPLGGGVTGAGFLRPDSGISPPFCISLYCRLGERGLGSLCTELLGRELRVDEEEALEVNGLSLPTDVSIERDVDVGVVIVSVVEWCNAGLQQAM